MDNYKLYWMALWWEDILKTHLITKCIVYRLVFEHLLYNFVSSRSNKQFIICVIKTSVCFVIIPAHIVQNIFQLYVDILENRN